MAGLDIPAPRGTGVAFVTGAGGFLGGATAAAFILAGWRVAAFGPTGHFAEDHPDVAAPDVWIDGPVATKGLERAVREIGDPPEVVFHAAGGASVAASVADPERDFERTVGSLGQTLTFLVSDAPAARLIYPSSAAVYGAGSAGPILETAKLEPISPYGRHKSMAEALIGEVNGQFGLDAIIIRFFSIYGPWLRKQILWELAGRLREAPETLELSGDGEEARDFLFVDDAVRLIGQMAARPPARAPFEVNGGTGQAVTVRQVAEGLRTALGVGTRIGFNGLVRAGDPRSLVADTTLATTLGFTPAIDLDAGLERHATWLKGRSQGPRT